MSIASMNDFALVPIPLPLYREILSRYPKAPHSLVQNVVSDFLERTADDAPRKIKSPRGVQFGPIFLPDGSQLRTKYLGSYAYIVVKGDDLEFDGKRYPSISKAVNAARGQTSNNAWRVLEIQRPGDDRWHPAEHLRASGGSQ